jgi:hypothetical protein
MGHYVQTMSSDKPGVRQDEELESHLNKGQFVVESPSPDLSPCNFVCVFFLNLAFISTIKGPYKANIYAEIANIPAAMSWLTLEMGFFAYSVYRTCI